MLFSCDKQLYNIQTLVTVTLCLNDSNPIRIKHIQEQPIGAQYYLATVMLVLYTHITSDSGKCSKKPAAFTNDSDGGKVSDWTHIDRVRKLL